MCIKETRSPFLYPCPFAMLQKNYSSRMQDRLPSTPSSPLMPYMSSCFPSVPNIWSPAQRSTTTDPITSTQCLPGTPRKILRTRENLTSWNGTQNGKNRETSRRASTTLKRTANGWKKEPNQSRTTTQYSQQTSNPNRNGCHGACVKKLVKAMLSSSGNKLIPQPIAPYGLRQLRDDSILLSRPLHSLSGVLTPVYLWDQQGAARLSGLSDMLLNLL